MTRITRRSYLECLELLETLAADEYAYMIARGGPDYPERAYGVAYVRVTT